MAQFAIHFTLAEAQERLSRVCSILEKIHRILDSAEAVPAQFLAASRTINGHTNGNGAPGGDDGKLHLAEADRLIEGLATGEKRELLRGLAKALLDDGIIIQDIRRGLIDFPAWKGSREVLLCYQLSDGDSIQYWHEVHAGFAGRRPLGEVPGL